MLFDFSISEQPGHVIISLAGELIEKNQANDLMKKVDELIAQDKSKIAIDMSDLKYMNSSGLNTLIQLLTNAHNDFINHTSQRLKKSAKIREICS